MWPQTLSLTGPFIQKLLVGHGGAREGGESSDQILLAVLCPVFLELAAYGGSRSGSQLSSSKHVKLKEACPHPFNSSGQQCASEFLRTLCNSIDTACKGT
jgi:hypothetical protein